MLEKKLRKIGQLSTIDETESLQALRNGDAIIFYATNEELRVAEHVLKLHSFTRDPKNTLPVAYGLVIMYRFIVGFKYSWLLSRKYPNLKSLEKICLRHRSLSYMKKELEDGRGVLVLYDPEKWRIITLQSLLTKYVYSKA